MELPLLSLLTAAVATWLLTCLGLWFWGLWSVVNGHELLPSEPRARFPCGLAELLIALGVFFLVGAGLQPLLIPSGATAAANDDASKAALLVPLIVLNSAATLTAVAAVLAWAGLLGISLRSMGLVPTWSDLLIGVVATVMLLPPIFAVQGLLTQLIEYHHPLLDLLQQPQPWLTVAALSISSTIVAPLTEEFVFRGLLQGWFSRLAGVGRPTPVDSQSVEQAEDASAVATDTIEGTAVADQFANGLAPETHDPSSLTAQAVPKAGRPWWPVLASSLAFSLVHLGQGPAPIALFFLALGLGYLYRQTGRIWAGVVVHMLLNGLSTAATIASAVAAQ